LHLDPLTGIEAARKIFSDDASGKRYLHFVSDFRGDDWTDSRVEKLQPEIDHLCDANVTVDLVDVAAPQRGESHQAPLSHDNLAVVEIRPAARVVAKERPVEFTIKMANYSASAQKAFLRVEAEGLERLEATQALPP